GVPGSAHGRTLFSSRLYGMNPLSSFFSAGCLISIFGNLLASGTSHGSAPLARYPSLKNTTGVMYLVATVNASMMALKQSAGDDAAMTGTGHSPLRPNIT